MVRVFRIETKDGKGICAAGTGICKKYHEASDKKRGCGFDTCFGDRDHEAGIDVILFGWRFAFQSLEAARLWFPLQEGRAAMEKAGAIVVEYEADDDILFDVGKHQLIFNFQTAKRVADHNVTTLE